MQVDVETTIAALVFQAVGDASLPSADHACRISRLKEKCWQVEMLRRSNMPQALNPSQLRHAMRDPLAPIVFIPREAVLTDESLASICRESSHGKMVIWETGV